MANCDFISILKNPFNIYNSEYFLKNPYRNNTDFQIKLKCIIS